MSENNNISEPFILFELDGTTFGVRSREVRHIEMVDHITPVPNVPRFIDGVVLTRGQVVPAVNLRARFGFERVPYDVKTRFLVVQEELRTLGLIVDTCQEFVSLSSAAVLPPPEEIAGAGGRLIEGIVRQGERLILILSISEVIKASGAEELTVLPEIQAATQNKSQGGPSSRPGSELTAS